SESAQAPPSDSPPRTLDFERLVVARREPLFKLPRDGPHRRADSVRFRHQPSDELGNSGKQRVASESPAVHVQFRFDHRTMAIGARSAERERKAPILQLPILPARW